MSAARSTSDVRREQKGSRLSSPPSPSTLPAPVANSAAASRRFNGVSTENLREVKQLKRALGQSNASPAAQPEVFSALSATDAAIFKTCYDLIVKHKYDYDKVLEELPEAALLPLAVADRFPFAMLDVLLQDHIRANAPVTEKALSDSKDLNKYMDNYVQFCHNSASEVVQVVVAQAALRKLAKAAVVVLGERTAELEAVIARATQEGATGRRE